ncbi:MAG: acyl-CoA dehydrogenase family protein [Hyphomicrobiaceae bacterium]
MTHPETSDDFTYGVPQEQDWNALPDDDFRHIIRTEFETHYPQELRFLPHRPPFEMVSDWWKRMSAKGWIAPFWPAKYGGMGLEARKALIYHEEVERWGIPRFQDHGIQMVGPVLIERGTEEQRRRFLPSILSCDHIWCQGYSEPGSGSDLASLQTKAVIDGDDFVINGQKIWTTMAHDASHIFILVRTDPDAKKQEGISFVLADMDQPGITVRPIPDMSGYAEFCEVFFDDARTPTENLVGELNKGWTVAKSLLGFERIFIGSPKLPEYALEVLETVASARGVLDDPVFRDKYVRLQLDVEHLGASYKHFADIVARGETLGADVSMLKVWATEAFQKAADLIIETAGPLGALKGTTRIGNVDVNVLAPFYKARPATIYGGSNEIQRNILSKAVLGL